MDKYFTCHYKVMYITYCQSNPINRISRRVWVENTTLTALQLIGEKSINFDT